MIASGYTRSVDMEETTALGAGRFIKNPYTMKELGRAVRDELAR